MITRRLGAVVTVLVLVASGAYLLVYLYRWEWNRALVAGVFFVAAEIAIVGTSLVKRLRAIEARLDAAAERGGPLPLDRLRETRPSTPDRFEWLDPTRMSVFVPVLLGAGVILSLLAHGIERLAASTATPQHERALAARLETLALPAGGLLGAGPVTGVGPLRTPVAGPSAQVIARRVIGGLFAIFLLASTIQVIADETQDRPDAHDLGASATLVLDIARRGTARSEVRTAEALFVACRHTIGSARAASDFTLRPDGNVAFTVTPGFGEHAQRRFVGCLEDAIFDRISASVVSLRHNP